MAAWLRGREVIAMSGWNLSAVRRRGRGGEGELTEGLAGPC